MAEITGLDRIIIGCKDGDAQCFSQLLDTYSRRCYGYFYRLTGNRTVSDDLLSELFVKLVKRIRTYKGGSFEAWLFKVASNVFYDYLRSKQRYKKILDGRREKLESELSIENKQSEKERFDQLQAQLEKLDPQTRELIMLRFYSQLSFKEIAKMRSEPIGTTLSKVHRGLRKLRDLMER